MHLYASGESLRVSEKVKMEVYRYLSHDSNEKKQEFWVVIQFDTCVKAAVSQYIINKMTTTCQSLF